MRATGVPFALQLYRSIQQGAWSCQWTVVAEASVYMPAHIVCTLLARLSCMSESRSETRRR
jgi:hypothetical protein